jgi:membrane protease YdiL (CAAX protease family)
MKSILNIYRIISYILLIIACILGIGVLATFFVALANPALLLNVFVAAAVVMYSISSFLFLVQGIDGNKQLRQGMKDFIRVNAFVATFFSIMSIFQSVTVIMNPSVLTEAINQFPQVGTGKELPKEMMLKVLKATMWFLLFYSLLLMVHIQISFRLLKQYAHLFGSHTTENNNNF